jgi:hypothetical protein
VFGVAADGSLGGRHEFLKISRILPETESKTFTPHGVRIDARTSGSSASGTGPASW